MSVTNDCTVNLNVHFETKTFAKISELITKIKELVNPALFFWYIGPYGLKEDGANFYKKHFYTPIQKEINRLAESEAPWKPTCHLYDLTAWGVLRKPQGKTIDDFNPNATVINGYNLPHIKCVKSSDFFNWIKSEENPDIVNYVNRTICARKEIHKSSEGHQELGTKLNAIFQATMIEAISDMDTQKVYSAFQYLEGIYLIKRIIEERLISQDQSQAIDVAFLLPNDESKYYYGETFKADLKQIIQLKFGERINDKIIKVVFYSFQYQFNTDRPYLTGKKTIESIPKSLLGA